MSSLAGVIWSGIVFVLVTISVAAILLLQPSIPPLAIFRNSVPIQLPFWAPPPIAVFLLLITTAISFKDIAKGLVGDDNIQPLAILALFLSQAYICVALDDTRIFSYIAKRLAIQSKGAPKKAFILFFLLSSILTIVTSNDIVVLTLTPILVDFVRTAGFDHVKFLIPSFFAANVWSMILLIGNPSNVIVGLALNIDFPEYSKWMAVPTILVGSFLFVLLYLRFAGSLTQQGADPANPDTAEESPREGKEIHTSKDQDEKVLIASLSGMVDWSGCYFGSFILFGCLFCLSISPWLGAPIWVLSVSFAGAYLIRNAIVFLVMNKGYVSFESEEKQEQDQMPIAPSLVNPRERFMKPIRGLPWAVIPFVLSMFIIVEALDKWTWISKFAYLLTKFSGNTFIGASFTLIVSVALANVMNNQPMTILMSKVLLKAVPDLNRKVLTANAFALVFGSNVAANITYLGALAGILWIRLLRTKDIEFPAKSFLRYGLMFMIPLSCLFILILIIEVAALDSI